MLRDWIRGLNKSDIESYRNLKRAIGILAMLLPLICILGGFGALGRPAQNSISHYYYTNMRDVLVGLLGCVSILLMAYSGYGIIDNVVTWAIGFAGAGVVAFPCPPYALSQTPVGIFQLPQTTSGPIHFTCAAVFFFLLAINSIFLFTMSDKKIPGKKKQIRDAIYVASGVLILLCLATLLVIKLAARDFYNNSSIALIFETVMLLAFGASWLVKGEIPLFRDSKAETKKRSRRTPRRA
jgi:hypothetical protein